MAAITAKLCWSERAQAGCKEFKPIPRGNLCKECIKQRKAMYREAKYSTPIPMEAAVIPQDEESNHDDEAPETTPSVELSNIIDAIVDAMALYPVFADELNRYIYAKSKGRYTEGKCGLSLEQWNKLAERPPVKSTHLLATFIRYASEAQPLVLELQDKLDVLEGQMRSNIQATEAFSTYWRQTEHSVKLAHYRGIPEFKELYHTLNGLTDPVLLAGAESKILDHVCELISLQYRQINITLQAQKDKLTSDVAQVKAKTNPFATADGLYHQYLGALLSQILDNPKGSAIHNVYSLLLQHVLVYDPVGKVWYRYDSKFSGHLKHIEVVTVIAVIREVWSDTIKPGLQAILSQLPPGKVDHDKIFNMLERLVYGCGERSHLLTTVKIACTDYDLPKWLDTDYTILGVSNGVIQLDGICPTPRMGKMSDYVSMCSPCYYDASITEASAGVKFIRTWMKRLFHEDSIVHEVFKWCASLLGECTAKHFYMWLGQPHSGKTALALFLEIVLGAYYVALAEATICGEGTKAGAADPNLASLHKCRLAMAPDVGDRLLNTGLIKRLTGHDTIYARALFSQGASEKVRCCTTGTFNHKPRFSDIDEAMEARLFVIPFDSKFDAKAPISPEEQDKQRHYPADPTFTSKLARYRNEMLWLMVQYWAAYRKEGINLVSRMQESVDDVKVANVSDIDAAIKEFINTRCDKVSLGHEDKLLMIKKAFASWLFGTYPNLCHGYNKLSHAVVTKKFMTLGPKRGHSLLLKVKPLGLEVRKLQDDLNSMKPELPLPSEQ